MIFGLNFNSTHIPPAVAKRFRKEMTLEGTDKIRVRLQGVCNSVEEKDAMLIQACNGHRQLHVESRWMRTSPGAPCETWYGIYAN